MFLGIPAGGGSGILEANGPEQTGPPAAVPCRQEADIMEIINCRLNHLENPLGYRLAHTAFSWQVEGSRAETARLVVAADPGMKQVRL